MTESINHLALARGHYAALRAWLQGLSLETVGGRYLGYTPEDGDRPLPDGRLLLRELLAVRDALIQRAHQHSRPDLAEALQRDIRNLDKGISRAGSIRWSSLGRPVRCLSMRSNFGSRQR